MTKQRMTLLMLILTLASCEYYPDDWCPYDSQPSRSNQRNPLTVEKLIGTWQCSYDTRVGTTNLKQIRFINYTQCEIIECEVYDTEWRTLPYAWTTYGGYIKFSGNNKNFSFKIEDYIWPELYIRDSFGIYSLRKIIN